MDSTTQKTKPLTLSELEELLETRPDLKSKCKTCNGPREWADTCTIWISKKRDRSTDWSEAQLLILLTEEYRYTLRLGALHSHLHNCCGYREAQIVQTNKPDRDGTET